MKNLFLRILVSCVVLFGATNVMATNTRVDIIFVMDSSGSMDNEASALVNTIKQVSQDLSSVYDLNASLWSITNEFDYSRTGFDSSVINEIPNGTVNQYEDWGPAAYDIATYYKKWRANTIKIVVPISDEGPENGDGLYQDDKDVINKARKAVDNTDINVVPIVAQSWHQDTIYKDYALLLSDKALKTGSGDLAAQFKTIIANIVADSSGKSLGTVSAKFEPNFNGGKLIIDAKGASKYDVNVKLDGVDILSTTTTSNNIPIAYPNNYDNTIAHKLDISYTAYALDSSTGQVLDQKSKTFTYTPLLVSHVVSQKFPELVTAKVEDPPIALANNDINTQVKSTGNIGDPVDISSGNFKFSHNDLIIPTAGIPLVIKRSYNSLETIRGWYFNIDDSIDISDINNIKVTWKGGTSKDTFIKAKNGWVSLYSTDIMTTDIGGYVIVKNDGTKYKFDTSGALIEISNKQNLGLVFENSGSTTKVKSTFGTLLATIVRNSSHKITSITDAAGNKIIYSYDGNNITSYTNRNGVKESYEYTNGLLSSIIGADGNAYVSNTYDAQGRVTTQLDGAGNQTTFLYTGDLTNFIVNSVDVTYPNGITRTHKFNLLLPTSIDGSGASVSFKYDANSKVKSVTDANGKSYSYERNSAGLTTKKTDPKGNSTLYKYDANNNLLSITNAIGQKVTFEYDAHQNLIKVTNNDGNSTSYEYNTNNQITKVTNPVGQSISYAYNAKGQLETITLPNGATTTYTYNALGNVKTITDALGRTVTYEYDKEGKVTKVTDPMGYVTKMAYNDYGDLVKVTDPKNRVVSMEYNTDGLLTKITLPNGTTVENSYDVMGRVIAIKDVLGRESKREYDDFGRVSKIIDPKGNEYTLTYDKVGNLIKVTDAKGNNRTTKYDDLYRPFKTVDANGVEVSTTTYNALSMPTKIENATGKSLEFSYDTLNRLQSSTLSGSLKSEAVYDTLGHITKLSDPKGAEYNYNYDTMGNLVKETNPIGKSNAYSYNILGQLVSVQDPNGVTTTYSYDKLDRVTKISESNATQEHNVSYSYDQVGNMLNVSDKVGDINYTYNINDQVTSRTGIYGNKISYEYDKAGRLSKLIYPDNKAISYFYDANNNVVKVTDFDGRETHFDYDTHNNLVKATYVNGAHTLYTYDANGRLLSMKNYDKNDKLISANELTRDSVGKITDNKETSPAKVDISKVKNFHFNVNAFNQITSSDEGNFTYDNNGNLLDYKYDGKENSLQYDISGNLVKAVVGGQVFTYTYDAEGNRVAVNGKHYIIDNVLGLSKPLAELDSSNGISKYYIWTNGLGYSVDKDGNVLVYLYDYQGNTNAILDQNNKLKASYRYDSYGQIISSDSTAIDNPFKYLGKYGIMSDSNALYYVRARYYSPQLKRWTQADIKRANLVNPLSFNRYALNQGDVVNSVDINGFFSITNMFNSSVNYTKKATLSVVGFVNSHPLISNKAANEAARNFAVGFGSTFISANTTIMKYTSWINPIAWEQKAIAKITGSKNVAPSDVNKAAYSASDKIASLGNNQSGMYMLGSLLAPTPIDFLGGKIIESGFKATRKITIATSRSSVKIDNAYAKILESHANGRSNIFFKNTTNHIVDTGIKWGAARHGNIMVKPGSVMLIQDISKDIIAKKSEALINVGVTILGVSEISKAMSSQSHYGRSNK
jgi:RHS repeat-associated protein